MRKVTVAALLLATAVFAAGCGDESNADDQVITRDASKDTEWVKEEETAADTTQSNQSEEETAVAETSENTQDVSSEEQQEQADASGDEEENSDDGTGADDSTNEDTVASTNAYSFYSDGVRLTPGEAFDASALPDANSVYTVQSCAVDGTDNVYSYTSFEVTAFDEGNGEMVYSIYFLNPDATTIEGLALGDSRDQVISIYGDGYEESGSSLVYTKGETQLSIILQDDVVVSIEYVLIL